MILKQDSEGNDNALDFQPTVHANSLLPNYLIGINPHLEYHK
jgi:hypothetical protein